VKSYRFCACGCGASLAGMRSDAIYHSEACEKRARRARNPDTERVKSRARQAVLAAIARGELSRPSNCERCGAASNPLLRKPDIEAHHHDYSKPLEVEWLCVRCHATQHAEDRRRRRASRDGRGARVYLTFREIVHLEQARMRMELPQTPAGRNLDAKLARAAERCAP
jgi:hypothetical protein